MSTYLVHMPRAEACHLAGIGPPGPAGPQTRALAAIGEWVHGISRRRAATIPVGQVVTDLTAILAVIPTAATPARGPFAPPGNGGPPIPGQVSYLGGGTVRLDRDALRALAGLRPSEDYRVQFTDAGPVLTVGSDTYLAREETPDIGRLNSEDGLLPGLGGGMNDR